MRNPVVDILKGIAILLVLLGHTGLVSYDFVGRFIYSFHVPLFFIVSGYFARSYGETLSDIRQSIIKDSKRLLLPYIATFVIIVLFTLIRTLVKHDISIVADKSYDLFYGSTSAGPIWFLLALFWMRTLFRPIMNVKKWALPICIVISIISIAIVHYITQLPFCILTAMAAMVFYAIGWYYKQYGFPAWLILLCITCWIGMLFQPRIDIYYFNYGIYPLTILGASGATYVLYKILQYIHGKRVIDGVLHVMQWLGVNSIVVLCFHTIDIHCCWVTMILKGLVGVELSYWPTQIIRDGFVFLFSWLYVTYLRSHILKMINL